MTIRTYFFVFILMQCSLYAHAQIRSASPKKLGFSLGLSGRVINIDALNTQLTNASRSPLSDKLSAVKAGFTYQSKDQNSYGSVTISYGSTHDDGSKEDPTTRLRLAGLAAQFHYDFTKSEKWLAYPYLGFGFQMAWLDLVTANNNVTFSQSLNLLISSEASRNTYLADGVLYFGELGMGIERQLPIDTTEAFLGFTAGYRLSATRSWKADELVVNDAPSFNVSGLGGELKLRVKINR